MIALGQILRVGQRSELAPTLQELDELEVELGAWLSDATSADERSDLHWCLYKARLDRAHFVTSNADAERLADYERALAHADASGYSQPRANARLLKARLLKELERGSEAIRLLETTLELLPEARSARPYVLFELATVRHRMGSYDLALATLDELETALPAGPEGERLRLWIDAERGEVHSLMGLLDVAARFIDSVAQRTRELRKDGLVYIEEILSSRQREANLALNQERFAWTIAHVDRCLADEELYALRPEATAVLAGIRAEARAELERRDPTRPRLARDELSNVLAGDLPSLDSFKFEVVLAEVLMRAGAFDAAEQRLSAARSRIEAWKGMNDAGIVPQNIALAAAEARLALARPGTERATLEARLERLTRAFEDNLTVWASAPIRRGGLGYLHHHQRRGWLCLLVELHLRSASAEASELALETVLRAQAQGSYVRSLGTSTGTAADVKALATERGGFVVLLPGPDLTFAFLVDRERVRIETLAADHVLRDLAQDCGVSLARGAEGAWPTPESKALAQALFASEVGDALETWRELTFVGLELVGDVPVELLPTPAGVPLGRERALARLPSLPLGLHLAERERARPTSFTHDLALVAAPLPGPAVLERWSKAATIELSADDATWIAAPFDPERVLVRTGRDATPAAVFSEELLGGVRVLQILAHSVLDRSRERPVLLVLSADGEGAEGLVSCDDVEDLGVAPPLVLLASCQTAQGPLRRGDAATGHMGGAWLAAGARAVLLAPTDLSYVPTVRASGWIHRRLAQGASPAEAVRFARVQLAAERPDDRSADWLQVVGLGHEPLPGAVHGADATALSSGPPTAGGPDSAPGPAATGSGRIGFVIVGLAGLALVTWIRLRRRTSAG